MRVVPPGPALLAALLLACTGQQPAPLSTEDGAGEDPVPRDGGRDSARPTDPGRDSAPPIDGGRDSAPATNPAPADAGPPPPSSDELFDPERVPRFDLTLPQASIDQLNKVRDENDPAQEIYVTGELRYGEEVISNIGVRIKGEASFRRLNQKPAFKIKFDEFVDKQSFHGLRRMTLNNMAEDPSFVAERLAYHVFRAAKLPAPRCNSAVVYLNGTLLGVYAHVEAEDKTFLRRWFSDDGGNLYEEGGKDFLPGNEVSFDLETNEPKNDRSDLKALIAALATAQPATFMTALGASLDLSHFLRFTAAEAAVNQWDMYGYTVFYPNNFRIYRDPTSARFVFLPWGMDMSMKPYRDSGKPHIRIFELARQYDQRNGPVTAGLIYQRCLQSPACKSAYSTEVAAMADIYESLGLEAIARRMHDQLRPHVMADTRREYTVPQFEAAFESVVRTIRARPAAMRADVK